MITLLLAAIDSGCGSDRIGRGLAATINSHPNHEGPWLVCSDWLEEQGGDFEVIDLIRQLFAENKKTVISEPKKKTRKGKHA